jgi:molecular chaperone GrpE (heat shock protein)
VRARPAADRRSRFASRPAAERFAALEQDARKLMRELGEARFAVEERDRAHRQHTQTLLLAVLEATDAFDRVLASVKSKPDAITPQMGIWLSNFRTARVLLDRALVDRELVRIVPSLGDSFDPYWHSLSGTSEEPGQPEGAIVEVATPGWVWQGALLRKAAVVVVHHGESQAPAPADQ